MQAYPAPAEKRTAAPTRRGSTGAKAVFASPLRAAKSLPLRTAENSCKLNPLRRKNAPPPPPGAARQPQKPFSQARSTQKSQGGSALTFSFYKARPLRRQNLSRSARRKTRAGLTRSGGKTLRRPHSARLDSRKSRFCKPASHKKSQGGKP